MGNNDPTFKLPDGATGSLVARLRELQQWWRGLPAGVRSPVWPWTVAALIILGMLLAFNQIVRGIVQDSEFRRKATALHEAATLRCNNLSAVDMRISCLSELNLVARAESM